MSEEEESNNENEENEDEEGEGEENEGEEKEEDENDNEENEGEENEDDENGDEEGEEKEDDEEDEEDEGKKKKKGKKKENKKEEKNKEEKPMSSKFSEDKLMPSKEIKMDLNLNSSNSNNNIFFNGNDITLANIGPPKKSTLQLLLEISSEMDTLSKHLEKVLPSPTYSHIEYNPNTFSYPINNNMDNQDLEIKNLIEKANALTNRSILNKNKEENGEANQIKTYEDKCCQSDDEIENSYNQQMEQNRSREEFNNNYNNYNNRRFPYDPYKHIDYYNDLKNSNNRNNLYRRRPFIYSQPENNNNYNNNNYNGYDVPFERYKSGNIEKAMDILLDKK